MSKLDKLKTLIPLHLLEQEAQQQIYTALELDFLLSLAIMPDCHTGYTLPIGGVALLDGVISPEYVGYDIGCGMCYVNTHVIVGDLFKTYKSKEKFLDKIYDRIPAGVGITRKRGLLALPFKTASGDKELNEKVIKNISIQLGTLGSGNHFIEIGINKKEEVTITIHSGSRKPGWDTAAYYMKLSRKVDKDLPKGFLHLNGEFGQQYLQDMNYMLEFALDNRKKMMSDILDLMGYNSIQIDKIFSTEMVNENHNHAVVDVESNTILHRKGATPSMKGQLGVIPGNMKSGVYLTEGLGNSEYLCSSSHGAGRKLSRKKAKEKIKMDIFEKQMDGIVARVNKNVLDEAPDAYKKIEDVIAMQEGIVINVVDHSKPIIVAKG